MTPPIDVSVVVLTYDRNALLERTLASLAAQRSALGLRHEVVVVDNHPDARARPPVERHAETGTPTAYICDPRRNMSHLRNTGAKASRGTVVAFIDDDEAAAPDWLDELVACLRRTGADVAIGPRLAELAPGCAAVDGDGDARAAFVRDFGLPPDAEFRLLDARGKPLFGVGMGNSAFIAARCLAQDAPFDPAFGTAGGEDTEFFSRTFLAGRRMVWAARACVTEQVQPHRTKIPYRLRRICRESQVFARAYTTNTTQRLRVRAELTAQGLAQAAVGGALAILTGEPASDRRMRWRALAAKGIGKLTWKRPMQFIAESHVR